MKVLSIRFLNAVQSNPNNDMKFSFDAREGWDIEIHSHLVTLTNKKVKGFYASTIYNAFSMTLGENDNGPKETVSTPGNNQESKAVKGIKKAN